MRRALAPPAVVVALAVALAGCTGTATGDPAPDPPTTSSAPVTTTTSTVPATTGGDPAATEDGFPVTVESAGGEVTIPDRPDAIVSLSPTATEMLFGIGAGDQVVAVDEFSTHPDDAPRTTLSGYTPNIEAIASYDPDLVLVSNDIDSVVGSLEALAIPVMVLPAVGTIDGVYGQLLLLGEATGNVDGARRLVDETRDRVAEILDSAPALPEPLTYFHELDPGLYSVTSDTFLGSVYAMVGLVNIADEADVDGFGYPQLSAEYVIERDPDLIFLADVECCDESPETVAARPGWGEMTAVRDGAIFPVDGNLASRWSQRIVDYLAFVVEVVSARVEEAGR
jgi:iron complex transport system substrate-binding protein